MIGWNVQIMSIKAVLKGNGNEDKKL